MVMSWVSTRTGTRTRSTTDASRIEDRGRDEVEGASNRGGQGAKASVRSELKGLSVSTSRGDPGWGQVRRPRYVLGAGRWARRAPGA